MLKILITLFLLFSGSSLPALVSPDEVLELYVGTFNRAADADGLNYWKNDSLPTQELQATAFFRSDEAQNLYPRSMSKEELVITIYQNLFNRSAEEAGIIYWVEQLNSGAVTRSQMLLAIIEGAKDTQDGNDLTTINNKVEVGGYYADNGLSDISDAIAVMSDVTDNVISVESAKLEIDYLVDNSHGSQCSYLQDRGFMEGSVEPVFVSVVLHYEESFNSMRPRFFEHRENLIALAVFLEENGIKLNLQPDWAFMQAVEDLEDDVMRLSTNGKNILRYLVEDLGHEIDPHAHEHRYNYADVAYMIQNLGVTPSNIVGGLIVDPPEDSKYDYLLSPIDASSFDYTWQAQWLWGSGTSGHTHDTAASGIWRPQGTYNFYENDDDASLPCIGKYTNEIDGIYDIIQKIENEEVEADRMLTATIFIGQGEVVSMKNQIQLELETLKEYEEQKKLIFAPLSEVAQSWQECYDAKGYLFIQP
ncbi:MAG: DUF4214 domain-containing protein [Campylobacterota bacterium]|nr:DUF4214 domain-containing protein [Campylobacterota bacterium]